MCSIHATLKGVILTANCFEIFYQHSANCFATSNIAFLPPPALGRGGIPGRVKGVRSPDQLKNNALTKPQIYDFLGTVRQSKFKTYMEKDLSTEYSESKTLQRNVCRQGV